MKRWLAFLMSLILCAGSIACSKTDHAMIKAHDLYISINCISQMWGEHPNGDGFAVSPHLVMTAGHVLCDEGDIILVHDDRRLTVPRKQAWLSTEEDILFIYTPDVVWRPAKLRAPVMGEEEVGYGIGADPIGLSWTRGYVMELRGDKLLTNATVWSGLSGSAMVGSDGRVIGMLTEAWPAFVGGYPGSFYSRGIPSNILAFQLHTFEEALPHLLQEGKWKQ